MTLVPISFLLVSLSSFAVPQQIASQSPNAARATELENQILEVKEQLLVLTKRETDQKKAIEEANSKLKQANLELKQVATEQDNASARLKKLESDLSSLKRADKKRVDDEKKALKAKQ
jgi:uncharacterized coiled-coil DUF342 family protein